MSRTTPNLRATSSAVFRLVPSVSIKVVGRVTSAAHDPERGVVALAYVRVEVPGDAELDLGGRTARPLDSGVGQVGSSRGSSRLAEDP